MSSITLFFLFIPLLAFILLAINLIFAPHNPYPEKDSAFECGFHSFLGQNRTQFSISFFIFALLFLLFDLEILLVYPYIVSAYNNSIYGLVNMLIFFLVLTLGFAFELGKKALSIDSRQVSNVADKKTSIKSKINNYNKKNSNHVSYINQNIRQMSSCMGKSKTFSPALLNNTLCDIKFSISPVLNRNLDSYDDTDNLIRQIVDPSTSLETIKDIIDETRADIERHRDFIGDFLDGDDITYRRCLGAYIVYQKAQDRLGEIENKNDNQDDNEKGNGNQNGNDNQNGNRNQNEDGNQNGNGNPNGNRNQNENGNQNGYGNQNGNGNQNENGNHEASGNQNNVNGNHDGNGNRNNVRGLPTSPVLYRTLDSYDNVDNLLQQIADPNTSEDTIRNIRYETYQDRIHILNIRNADPCEYRDSVIREGMLNTLTGSDSDCDIFLNNIKIIYPEHVATMWRLSSASCVISEAEDRLYELELEKKGK